ncbi:MAG: LysR family transcriptional regulator [Aliivibrio sp.]|uniref:LysR family transcriptional regulator n=1 Tax=Aliivibrio sp. TaxID=1872443 RepID=UPI001A4E02EE|nr:LysR family transcriptional regulator [Aliivibrio sp.]
MDNKLDLNLLLVFLEVYRLQSITLASDALGMTQPGVSGALKRLQQQIGAQLFVREGRGISPTHIAVQLAAEIEPAFQSVHSALGNVSDFDPQSTRTFTVYSNEPMMLLLQQKIDQDPTMGNCEIEFHLTPNKEEEIQQKLSLQKADLAIDVGLHPNHSYEAQTLFEEDIVCICANDHHNIQGSINKAQYYAEKHITIKVRRSELYAADYFTEEAIGPRNVSCECHSLMSMMALVSTSQSIGTISSTLAKEFGNNFNLQILPSPFVTKPVIHNMMWHKRNHHQPAHKWLRDKLMVLACAEVS